MLPLKKGRLIICFFFIFKMDTPKNKELYVPLSQNFCRETPLPLEITGVPYNDVQVAYEWQRQKSKSETMEELLTDLNLEHLVFSSFKPNIPAK